MTEHRIRYLFERYFTDSCSEDERQEFLQIIHEGRQDDTFLKVMQECWEVYAPDRKMPERTGEKVINRIIPPSHRPMRWLTGIAALVAACLAFLYFFKGKQPAGMPIAKAVIHDVSPGGNKAILTLADGKTIVLDSAADGKLADQGSVKVVKLQDGKLDYQGSGTAAVAVRLNIITTPYGGKYQVTLNDGTKVWLNAASTLIYPTAFTGSTREVTLKGEGYFEVARNAAQPFIVKTGDMKVHVLGTHFNIMAYDEEDAVRTSLLEGAVSVSSGGISRSLTAGDQGVWNKKDKLDILPDADLEAAVAWKNGLFQFHSTDMQVLMRQLTRWYNVKIVYASEAVKDETFSGSIPSSEKISEVLKLLEMTNTVHFDVTDRTITVRSK